jgi:hypothetical protein
MVVWISLEQEGELTKICDNGARIQAVVESGPVKDDNALLEMSVTQWWHFARTSTTNVLSLTSALYGWECSKVGIGSNPVERTNRMQEESVPLDIGTLKAAEQGGTMLQDVWETYADPDSCDFYHQAMQW